MVTKFATLADALTHQASSNPDKIACSFVSRTPSEAQALNYAELDRKARNIASFLIDHQMTGKQALLIYGPGLDFVAAFFGCIYAGTVAVPLYPPKPNQSLDRMQSIVKDAQAELALTTSKVFKNMHHRFQQFPLLDRLHWASTDQVVQNPEGYIRPDLKPEHLAMLQYTSGSTSDPKGVMISHDNIVWNQEIIRQGSGSAADRPIVSWLPLFHDMGLFGSLLNAVYTGSTCHLMSPTSFLQNPFLWLTVISETSGYLSGGPNFAFDLCVQRITEEQKAQLDLSSWEVAFCGAEPIRPETLTRFTEAFSSCGLSPKHLFPCYGLAEATLFVTGCELKREPLVLDFAAEALEEGRFQEATQDHTPHPLVGCGHVAPYVDVQIVQPETLHTCADGEVGEIWVKGPNVAQGYLGNSDATRHTFEAYISDTGAGPYMRTGDLGFLHRDELFVTGRIKDMLIFRGRNFYPQDIEATAFACDQALRLNRGAAFSVSFKGDDRLVLVLEMNRGWKKLDLEALAESIRDAIVAAHDIAPMAIALLRPGRIPLTSSGKIQRRKCCAKFEAEDYNLEAEHLWFAPDARPDASPPSPAHLRSKVIDLGEDAIKAHLIKTLAEHCEIAPEQIDPSQPFSKFGLDSLKAATLSGVLQDWLETEFSPTMFYEFPTVEALAMHLSGRLPTSDGQPTKLASFYDNGPIAVIGMACRFPGAADLESFWQLLESGTCAIGPLPEDRRRLYPYSLPFGEAGYLPDVAGFDAAFFNISPREAEQMDPQQRLLLEVAWQALEASGHKPDRLGGSKTGVFVGISTRDYQNLHFRAHDRFDAYSGTGLAHSIAANRLSYVLDLRGPSLAIDTACSSSLVALHHACESLASGQSDMALAGGVNLILTPELEKTFSRAGMLSPDARCKTFDAAANGYVRGEGCGVLVLKRLSDAQRDGDPILGIVKGSAVNQDGRSNGLTAPNRQAQHDVILNAIQRAGILPEQLSYLEAHGTGTALGDPIEVNNLTTIVGHDYPELRPCYLGSVKTNIGHLEAAAGIAGVIKVLLAMNKQLIPKTLHFNNLNPLISLDGSRIRVADQHMPWIHGDTPNLAGVSSFGFGGTNAHVILSTAPQYKRKREHLNERPLHLFTLSAKQHYSLKQTARKFAGFLKDREDLALGDICYTVNTGRASLKHRLALVSDNVADLAQRLEHFANDIEDKAVRTQTLSQRTEPKLVFMFTGQGSQYSGMGYEFFLTEETFRTTLQRCNDLFIEYLKVPLLSVFYPEEHPYDEIYKVDYTQEALFSLEIALFELLKSWGIKPDVVMGHSLGEYAAAYAAGVFTLEEAIHIVARRKQLLDELEDVGAMAAIYAPCAALEDLLAPFAKRLSVAAMNGPNLTVISGFEDALDGFLEQVTDLGFKSQKLKVNRAFHAPTLDPMLPAFEKEMAKVQFKPHQMPLVSAHLGRFVESGELLDANYWLKQTRQSVRFHDAVDRLVEAGYRNFMEIGPNPNLTNMAKRIVAEHQDTFLWLPTLVANKNDWKILEKSIAELYLAGYPIDWEGFDSDFDRRRIHLPTYYFDHLPYWLELEAEQAVTETKPAAMAPAVEAQVNSETKHVAAPTQAQETPSQPVAQAATADHQAQVLATLCQIFAQLMKVDPNRIDLDEPFLEMGADSIILAEAIQKVEATYKIDIPIRMLFDETPDLRSLATSIAAMLPASEAPLEEPAAPATVLPAVAQQVPAPEGLEGFMQQQLQILQTVMQQQLSVLQGFAPGQMGAGKPVLSTAKAPQKPKAAKAGDANVFVPFQPIKVSQERQLPPALQRHRIALVEALTRKTQKSKAYAEAHRPHMADNRASVGFRLSIKEMLYPIVSTHSQGAHIWDLDGNRYVDLTMGFGVNLFGHNEPFIQEALKRQVDLGMQLGPQAELSGEVARLICEVTKQERVTFTNSGTEAVMTAMRLARLGTGRDKVVVFAGSYHGSFDGVLAKKDLLGEQESLPIAPGVSRGIAGETIVLDYGSSEALEYITEHGNEIAAVLVEPVQSRRPDLQPKAFLQELRRRTEQSGSALIFDEIITGFRMHPQGAQHIFGIKADLTTYGKVVGGGMPIGIVAGRRKFLDGIDGGLWQFGNQSFPEAPTTFFAGTFCKHPLALAASHAILERIQQQGPALQEALNQKTQYLCDRLNTFFEDERIPIKMVRFGSLFRFAFNSNMDLLFYHLLEKGIYIWEGRNCFLSTAHTDQDISFVIQAVQDSIIAMRAAGHFPEAKEWQTPQSFSAQELANAKADAQTDDLEQASQVALSSAQQAIRMQCMMDERLSIAYNNATVIQLSAPLDVNLLQASIDQVIARHESLRTIFPAETEVQEILDEAKINLQVLDFSARESAFDGWLQQEAEFAFDLAQAPLLRAFVITTPDGQTQLLMKTHQIVADGISLAMLLTEVAEIYSAFSLTQKPSLAPAYAFRKHLAWEQNYLASSKAEAARLFFKQLLTGDLPMLELPTDFTRPALQTYRGQRVTHQLDGDLMRALKALGSRRGCTLYMVMLAACNLLLKRLSGQQDLITSVIVSGRNHVGNAALIGGCINQLPFRCQVGDSLKLDELLAQVRNTLLDVFEHQDYPMANIVQDVNPVRDPSYPILTPIIINMDRPLKGMHFHNREAELLPPAIANLDVDLFLNLTELSDGMDLVLDYNPDLYLPSSAERLLQQLETLLRQWVTSPDGPLGDYSILSADEQATFWQTGTANTQAFSQQTVAELFSAQAGAQAEKVAIIAGEASWTYDQLERFSNQIANWLLEQELAPEAAVGLCIPRSYHMIAAMLGIFKAGACYVPLDPEAPLARLKDLQAQTQMTTVVTVQGLADKFSDLAGHLLLLDGSDQTLDKLAETPIGRAPWPQSLAYTLFTSGSTGKPKGVQVSHLSLSNFVQSAIQQYQIKQDDIALQFASLSFDTSLEEIFPTLIQGATLMLRDESMLAPETLIQACKANGITLLNFPTAFWSQLVTAIERNGLKLPQSVRGVIIGGEAAQAEQVLAWRKHVGAQVALYNTYGPTEATVVATTASLHQLEIRADHQLQIPIGQPLPNVSAFVLDQQGNPCATGAIGQLYLGGVGLARGYVGAPEITAAAFVPHPHRQGERLYATGDLASYDRDGALVFRGRVDHQVKIRGFRIETGEIEATLLRHPMVSEAVVTTRPQFQQGKALLGYVAASDELQEAELKTWLGEQLPAYMVPTRLLVLDAFPTTANGKVDRKALPLPVAEATEVADLEDPFEQKLAQIWMALLDCSQLSGDANFFDLGGHSLLATQLITRIQEQFDVALPMRKIFELQSLRHMSAYIRELDEAGQTQKAVVIERVDRTQPLALSSGQKRLWFLDRLHPGQAAYNVAARLVMHGPLDVECLQKAYQKLQQRHEILSVVFYEEEGDAQLKVKPDQLQHIELIDLSHQPSAEAEINADVRAKELAQQGFDLEQGPLCRLSLLRLSEDHHHLVLNMHHIISDGWSLGIMADELLRIYHNLQHDQPIDLPELTIQYTDYAHWHNQLLQSDQMAQQAQYWYDKINGFSNLELPLDFGRPNLPSYAGSQLDVRSGAETLAGLQRICQEEQVTLFMLLLAAYAVVLQRFSNQEDFCIGTPIANRQHRQTEALIGFFANTQVFRMDLTASPSFRQLLAQIKQDVLAAQQHQDYPFESLVEALQVSRDLRHNPVFQVVFALQNTPMSALSLPGLELSGGLLSSGTSKFDLALSLTEENAQLVGEWEYASDLFKADSVQPMVDAFVTLLSHLPEHLDTAVKKIPLMDDLARHKLIRDFNLTQDSPLHHKRVEDLFADMVEQFSECVALQDAEGELSYKELDERAWQWANQLRALQVKSGDVVAIQLERQREMIPLLIATLRVGATFLPLDPAYPSPRCTWLCEDANAQLLLTDKKRFETNLPIYMIGELASELRQAEPFDVANGGIEAVAYIMYTSGSTGKPKGVCVPHRAIERLVIGNGYANFYPDQGWLQTAPFSFDAATLEIWGPLLNGGRCVLYPSRVPDAAGLQQVIQSQGIQSAWLTTALFNTFVDESPEVFAGLEQLIIGGETQSVSHIKRFKQRHPQISLINAYGPTESTTFTTCHTIQDENTAERAIPIGIPIAYTQVYLLDRFLEPVPQGAPGELYIGGLGLAHGYLNRPELTALSFRPDPFGSAGSRIYKSGDLARFRADGAIDFLGRIDFQVKIRGFRIEPGEIDAAVTQIPGIGEAITVVLQFHEEKYLATYYTLKGDQSLDAATIKANLAERMPKYMVPNHLIEMKKLPLNVNGKVDRKALPDPRQASQAAEELVTPRNENERKLVEIWCELLDLESIGVNQNFFELGGHSLMATKMVSRVRAVFEKEIELVDVFTHPTVESLASRISQSGNQQHHQITATASKRATLSYAQMRLWFLDQLQPGNPAYNMPVAYWMMGALNLAAFEQAVSMTIARHASLRTVFRSEKGMPQQHILDALPWKLEVTSLADVDASERHDRAIELAGLEAAEPFDLARGPLVRVRLLHLNTDEHVLLATLHHIISDGWSMDLLVNEIGTLYRALAQGQTPQLAELKIQYADVAQWQQQEGFQKLMTEQLAWWQQELQDAPALLNLPTDFMRPVKQTYVGDAVRLTIPGEISAQLKAYAQAQKATPFMTLLTAWYSLLYAHSGDHKICVGSPVAGRLHQDQEPLIGMFVNTLVLCAELDENQSFSDLLGAVRQTCLSAFAHQEVPFERVVDGLQPKRDPSFSPLFQVGFALQNLENKELNLEGLLLSPLEGTIKTAKYDLNLMIWEADEQFTLELEFNCDLYRGDTIAKMAHDYVALLTQLVDAPEKGLAEHAVVQDLVAQAAEHQQGQLEIDGLMVDRQAVQETLTSYAHVKQAALRPQTQDDETFLVAYLEMGIEASSFNTEELLAWLATRLPRYQTPRGFVAVEQFPRDAAGQIDFASLPQCTLQLAKLQDEPPATILEGVLHGIWCDLLAYEQISRHANFFDLGGHSLLATRLIARVREHFKIDLKLEDFFENPTLKDLAKLVEMAQQGQSPVAEVPIRASGHPAELSFSQQQIWIACQIQEDASAYNMHTALELKGKLNLERLQTALTQILSRHQILRTCYPEQNGKPKLVLLPEQAFRIRVTDLSHDPNADVAALVYDDSRQAFDLATELLVRVSSFQLNPEHAVISFTMHHIIGDAWSLQILVEEVAELYSQLSVDVNFKLPAPAIQYSDYAAWQQDWLSSAAYREQLCFWQQHLAGSLEPTPLPLDGERNGSRGAGARFDLVLDTELSQALKLLSKQAETTLFMTLLAGIVALLHQLDTKHRQDILLGTAHAGRDRHDSESLMGCLINMLVLRVQVKPGLTFKSLLKDVRKVALDTFQHSNMPFDKLVEALKPERKPGLSPFFQMTFGLQNAPSQELQLQGVEVLPYPTAVETARYDLTLWMEEVGEGLRARWTYDTNLFKASTIERMASAYETLLRDAVATPEKTIEALSVVSAAEKAQLTDQQQAKSKANLGKLKRKRRNAIKL